MKRISAFFALLLLTVGPAAATTLNIVIDSITGDGESTNLGFYSISGDDGTFRIITSTDRPEPPVFFSFPGEPFKVDGVTARGNTYAYEPTSGILTMTGFLGGVTGDFEFPGLREFTYDIQVDAGLSFTGLSDLPDFYNTATGVSGSVRAFFSRDIDGPFFEQTLSFSSPSEVPLPAGAGLLLSGLILLGLKRKLS